MKHYKYAAILRPEAEGGFTVRFPQLPGCLTQGDDLFSASKNALDAMMLHVTGMIEDGETLPDSDSAYTKSECEHIIIFTIMVGGGRVILKMWE